MLLLLVALFGLLLVPLGLRAQTRDTVWMWSARCSQPQTIALDVQLDKTLIYHTRLPMCRVERTLETDERYSFPSRLIDRSCGWAIEATRVIPRRPTRLSRAAFGKPGAIPMLFSSASS
jgi:hypothetical protein